MVFWHITTACYLTSSSHKPQHGQIWIKDTSHFFITITKWWNFPFVWSKFSWSDNYKILHMPWQRHDSCAVMACVKLCSNIIARNEIIIIMKWSFNQIWILMEMHWWNGSHRSISLWFFTTNLLEITFCFNSVTRLEITAKFCNCHNSTHAMMWKIFSVENFFIIWMRINSVSIKFD